MSITRHIRCPLRWLLFLPFLQFLTGCGGGGSGTAGPAPVPVQVTPKPVQFHCAKDATCPEIIVAGDLFASLGAGPAPFRGYADPSLEYDPATGDLWMTYSWLDVLVTDPGPPIIDFGVRTHVARSTDNGNSFTFERAVNGTQAISHPDSGQPGWLIHEVSTLMRQPDGLWQVLWLQYFDPLGDPPPDRGDFQYNRSIDSAPGLLGMNSEPWARGTTTTSSFGAPLNLNDIPELSDCAAHTEPALFAFDNSIYLATYCIVIDGTGRRTDLERLVLLREKPGGYDYVATLLDSTDAADLGVDVLEQADLAVARDGEVLLLVTPIVLTDDPRHKGCRVFSFDDFAAGRLRRDGNGAATLRAVITADGNGLGPGLCTYDANSDTGVLIVITTIQDTPFEVEFSLRATGVHP